MVKLKRRAAGLAVVVGLIGLAPLSGVEAAQTEQPSAVAAKSCQYGKIDGQSKRLCRGQFCKRSAKSQYPKYGFRCNKLDRNGRYHLR